MTSPEIAETASQPQGADFYGLDEQAKVQRYQKLARAALPRWGMASARVSLIKHRENAVFEIALADASRAAMRIHRAGYHTDESLRSELQWMQALNEFGVRTPTAIPTTSGEPFARVAIPDVPEERQVDLLSWVSGTAMGSIEEGVSDVAAAARNYRLVGGLVARMHAFTSQWSPPQGFKRLAYDAEGLIGDDPRWGRFWELEALDSQQRETLHAVRHKARAELASYGQGRDRYGLIHADAMPENFLVDTDGSVNVIDFDDAGYGWLLYDFATAMFFHLGQDYFDALLQAMIEGYTEVRDLPPEFEERLPLFLLLRGTNCLGWAHTRSETEIAQQLTPVVVPGVMALADAYLGGDAGS